MQIDYFTFAAQIINFLVLVFLLRHFLYRPVIRSMKEREQKISDQLKDAEEKRIQADQLAEASARPGRRSLISGRNSWPGLQRMPRT